MIRLMYFTKAEKPYMMIPVFTDYTHHMPAHISSFHIHPVYHIVFMISGKCHLENGNEDIVLNEKDIVVIDPMEKHIFRTYSDETVYFAFNFTLIPVTDENGLQNNVKDGIFIADPEKAPLESIVDIILEKKKIVYDKTLWNNILGRIERLHSDVVKKHSLPSLPSGFLNSESDHINRCAGFFMEFYDDLISNNRKGKYYGINNYGPLVRKIMIMIEDHIHEKLDTKTITNKLGYSKGYLGSIFKQNTGITILTFTQRLKIQKACDYLKFTDKTVSDIAFLLGYNSTQYFCKIFKLVKNMTPKEYESFLER